MKKGIITVEKISKGYKVTLVLDNGKIQSPPYTRFDEKFIKELPRNIEVFYELKNGALNLVCADLGGDKVLFPIQIVKQTTLPGRGIKKNYTQLDNSNTAIGTAHAPYNFIPINESVVKSPVEAENVHFNAYNLDCYTGRIDLEIKSLTPLYIRGMNPLTQSSNEKSPEFFRGKNYCIPGSSLRGAIRTIMEIVSYSKMGSINKNTLTQRFHYRAFADQSLTLREEYSSKMLASERNPLHYYPKINAGVIKKEGLNYYIYPGKHFKVEEDLVKLKSVLSELMSIPSGDKYKANKDYKTGFKQVSFKADPEAIHPHSKNLKYAKVTDISNKLNEPGMQPGYLIQSGWMIGPRERPRGKHMHWVIGNIDHAKRKNIPTDVIDNYNNDKLREGIDLIGMLNNKNSGFKEVPCFYIADHSGIITSFGYTGMFRLAYDRTMIEFFPEGHRTKTFDFTEVLFGKNDIVPSRIFVEDASLIEGDISDKVRIPGILGGPKPTTFQHYLKQNKELISTVLNNRGQISGYKGIVDYNQKGQISGYKLYWHQKNINYPSHIEIAEPSFKKYLTEQNSSSLFPRLEVKNNRIKFNVSGLNTAQYDLLVKFILTQEKVQYTAIKPILSEAKFIGKIRFENLTEIEFGALMFVLSLPNNLCYKIGMGKALGFGSVKISPKVYMSDRKNRYSDLMSEWYGSSNHPSELPQEQIAEAKKAFENFILAQINSKAASLWDEERMKELNTMLDFDNNISGAKAEFMLINKPIFDTQNNPVLNNSGQQKTENEYKSRPILPPPSEYIKRK